MFNYIRSFIQGCVTCQKTKTDSRPPKAPLVPMFVPTAPMQRVLLDIGYLPKDGHGYQYILLIGDTFSKFIQAISLKDQTAPVIADAFLKNWVYIHGTPSYLLTDQGSNVDGQLMRDICTTLGIEKRRSSAYHSQGNGFAERNIRTVKETLRTVLLNRKMQQTQWRKLLPELIFALNASESKSTQCIPFNVVFGRTAVLPSDIIFQNNIDEHDQLSAAEYESKTTSLLQDVFSQVIQRLHLNQQRMQRQYNVQLRFINYKRGDKVWLKIKHYKTGENRKLAPRRTGPWKVLRKLPNGVNFEIANAHKEKKIVHHNRLLPVIENEFTEFTPTKCPPHDDTEENFSHNTIESSSESDYFPSDSGNSDEEEADNNENDIVIRNYPRRQRRAQYIPGAIPWETVHF